MKLIITPIFIFTLFLMPCLAQENLPCPEINVIAPKDVVVTGQIMTFSVSISEISKNSKLDYYWKVSAGTIIKGQKTPAIEVDTTGNSGVNVIAMVEIKGLAKNCMNTTSGSGVLAKPPNPFIHNCDDYGKMSKDDEFARLDTSVINLLNDSNSIAIIHIESKKIKKRVTGIFNYLTKRRKIAENRLIFTIKNSEVEYARVCLWVKGQEMIGCGDDCQIIKGEDFNPKKLINKTF